jgi:hypothetical protein
MSSDINKRIRERLRQKAGRKKYIWIELNKEENFFISSSPISDSSMKTDR